MEKFELPIRNDLAGLEPYGAPQLDLPVRLNVNEFPYSPPPAVVESILKAVSQATMVLNRYPDRDFAELRQSLANYLNVEANLTGSAVLAKDNIWAANGSNEVMQHLFQAYGGPSRTALTFGPTYSMYPEYARDTFTNWHEISRNNDFNIDLELAGQAISETQPALIILCSPNNPSGTALTLPEIEFIIKAVNQVKVPGTNAHPIIIVDEAYGEFRREGTPSALELLPKYPNLAVSRTMSKAFGAAGLRLGYLAASPELITALRLVRLPYHLSSLTQAAAVAALEHADEMQAAVAELRHRRDELEIWLKSQNLETTPSDANFVMFGRFSDRHQVWQNLADQGVLIREVGPPGWLRVSVGTEAETQMFQTALANLLAGAEIVPAGQ